MERKHEVILHRDKGLAALPFPDTRLMLWLISLRGWLPSCPLSSALGSATGAKGGHLL